MIVYNYGLPLSGTRLTGAVITAVLNLYGVPFRSLTPPQSSLVPILRAAIESGTFRWQTLILTTHDWTDEIAALVARATGHSVAFAALRDPRDVCAALNMGPGGDLDRAIAQTQARVAQIGPMLRASGALGLRYERAIADPAACAQAIAGALDLRLGGAEARRIGAEAEHLPERLSPGAWRHLAQADRDRIGAALGGAARKLGYGD